MCKILNFVKHFLLFENFLEFLFAKIKILIKAIGMKFSENTARIVF